MQQGEGRVRGAAFAVGLRPPWLFGVVHLRPLPGSPRYGGDFETVLRAAVVDLGALVEGGADGAVIENFGDAPFYPDRVPPGTIAAMTAAVVLLRAQAPDSFRIGVNVLRNDAASALSVAVAGRATFIRVNVHVGAAVSDQGILTGAAHETLRLRRQLNADVAILADVAVKHAAPLAPRPIVVEAQDCVERGFADGLLVTGGRTGEPVDREQLMAVRRAVPGVPVLAASGVTRDTAPTLTPHCDGFIVGTSLKRNGRVDESVDVDRVRDFMEAIRRLRR